MPITSNNHPLLDNILYINMEKRTDRNEHVQKELDKLNTPNGYERFNAVCPKNGNGEIGCSLSHLRCIEIAKERNYPFVFICEDDITFTNPKLFQTNLQRFWDFFGQPLTKIEEENFSNDPPRIKWDVIIVGGNNGHPFEPIYDFAIRVYNCQTTAGYIVANHYYDTLLKNFREGVENLMRHPTQGPLYAVDIYWKKMQRDALSRWFMIVPATVTQYTNYSDLTKREVNYDYFMLTINK